MTNLIIFCCVIGIIIIYGLYLLLGMRHLTKEYVRARRALDMLPASYQASKYIAYLCITKDTVSKWWRIEYKSANELGFNVCRETLKDAAESMVCILKENQII